MIEENNLSDSLKEIEHHAYKVSDEITKITLLVNGESEGGDCWAYVSMLPSKAKEYLSLSEEEEIDLEDYGEILFSGSGETPPNSIKKEMKEKYKIDHDFEKKMTYSEFAE